MGLSLFGCEKYEQEYRIGGDTAEDFFEFEKTEIACIILGDKIEDEIRDKMVELANALQIPLLFLKSDEERSRYFLVHSAHESVRIYELDELYEYLENISTL